jgi:hypothetical protein
VRPPDHVALALGSGGKHVKCQSVGTRHVGNGEMDALTVHQRGDEGDAAAQAVELRHQHDGPVPFGRRYRGGQIAAGRRATASFSSTEVRIELTVLLPRITADKLRQSGALQNC